MEIVSIGGFAVVFCVWISIILVGMPWITVAFGAHVTGATRKGRGIEVLGSLLVPYAWMATSLVVDGALTAWAVGLRGTVWGLIATMALAGALVGAVIFKNRGKPPIDWLDD